MGREWELLRARPVQLRRHRADWTTLTGTVGITVLVDTTAPQVLVSTSADRAGPVALAGTGALTGPVAIPVEPAAQLRSVRFHLDDPLRLATPRQSEREPLRPRRHHPVQRVAQLFDPSVLTLGDHDLTAVVTYLDGREAVVNLVVSSAPPPADIAGA